MDHIRQAVSKAREKRIGTSGAMGHGGMARSRASIDMEEIGRINCNFENFSDNRIISNEHDPVLNSYRVLRTRVLQKMESEGWRSIAVVSSSPGAGKTVTAINLAIAISSSENSRVSLLDFDFYRPSIARYLGVDSPGSVLDFFEDEKPIEQVAKRTNLPGLLLMANERVSRRGAEFLSSPKASNLLNMCSNELGSRITVIDTSPILGCDDTIALLPNVDCVLLVATSGQTRSADLVESKRLLGETNIVGTILNKAPKSSSSSSYYYY